MNRLEQAWRLAFVVADQRGIAEWAKDNIKFGPASPFPGPYDADNLPHTKRILEAYEDPDVRKITVCGCPQESGKTVAAQVCMAWQEVNDPATMGFYTDNDTKASTFATTRWKQMQDSCEALSERIDSATKKQTVFKDGSFILIRGAEAEGNRQSDTLRIVIMDEAWRYPAGWMSDIQNRTGSFHRTNDYKIMSMGTGGVVGSDFHNEHWEGTREVFETPCPHCGEYHGFTWDIKAGGVFRWTEIEKPEGGIDYKASGQTAYIECPHCKEAIHYDADERLKLNRRGRWRATNPDADPSNVSLTIPIFAVGSDWRKFVEQWLRAVKGNSIGRTEAMMKLIQHGLAEFWEDRAIIEKKDLPYGGYTREDMLTGRWEREVVRIGTVDYQEGMRDDREHFWFAVRAYAENGDSRLVDCGRIDDSADVDARMEECGLVEVPLSRQQYSRVFMDCAHKPNVVFDLCMRYSWMGIRGEDRDTKNHGGQYIHTIQKVKGGPVFKVFRNYSELKWYATGIGTKRKRSEVMAPWFSVNNQGCEDILYEMRAGKALSWTVPDDIDEWCPEYADQINSHAKKNVSKNPAKEDYRWTLVGNSESNPDHLYDCEKYQVAAALRAGVLKPMDSEEEES